MPAIGVTGHRFLAEVDRIEAGVVAAMDRIEARFPDGPLQVLSSLSEGADQLVVRIALARPRRPTLVLVLPDVPGGRYGDDFHSEHARITFASLRDRADRVIRALPPTGEPAPVRGPAAPGANETYVAAADAILDRADVLVAVWDGKPGQGRGGTAYMVAMARQNRMPLAWIHAGNRRRGTREPTSLGPDQGRVTFEFF